MLSRTADNLFWLSRYVERADHVARMIEATARLASLPRAYGGAAAEWESALIASGAHEAYLVKNECVSEQGAIDFLLFDEEYPSSVRRCLAAARANARAVRTALTVETWEAINSAWLEFKAVAQIRSQRFLYREEASRLLELAKKLALDFDGSACRTMLRNDAFYFMRLGHSIEQADNMARLLDVKYHLLLPETEAVGGSLDYFQWTSLLRAVSAHTAYHWVYRQSIKPWLIADLLILKPDMPRSLISCYEEIVRYLDLLAQSYGRQGPAQRWAHSVYGKLRNASMQSVFQMGLHEFIEEFIEDNTQLGSVLAEQYLIH